MRGSAALAIGLNGQEEIVVHAEGAILMTTYPVSTGKAGGWTVTLETSDTENAVFSVWLQSRKAYIQFNIRDLEVLGEAARFLRTHGPEDRWFEVQDCLGGVLAFVLHDDSFRIRLNVAGGQMFEVRFDFSESDELSRAMEDALHDAR